MSTKILNLSDAHKAEDTLNISKFLSTKGTPKKTRITISNPITKEIYGVYENKVVISGAMYTGCRLFGIHEPDIIPNYDQELGIENPVSPGAFPPEPGDDDYVAPELVSLFCVGDSGCGSTESDVKVANFIDRISPKTNASGIYEDIIPFRYLTPTEDEEFTSMGNRDMYFGRKVVGLGEDQRIMYFFKKFETTPQLFLKYADGTAITPQLYNFSTNQDADCYVEMELLINSLDLKEYFDRKKGWNNARFSTISLCSAWVRKIGNYNYYQNIYPYTKLNFPFIRLIEAEQAVQFNYAIFY